MSSAIEGVRSTGQGEADSIQGRELRDDGSSRFGQPGVKGRTTLGAANGPLLGIVESMGDEETEMEFVDEQKSGHLSSLSIEATRA
jgi:microcystin-dependent protein